MIAAAWMQFAEFAEFDGQIASIASLCQFHNFIAGDVPCALFGTVDLSGLRSGFVDASFGRRHLSEREHTLT